MLTVMKVAVFVALVAAAWSQNVLFNPLQNFGKHLKNFQQHVRPQVKSAVGQFSTSFNGQQQPKQQQGSQNSNVAFRIGLVGDDLQLDPVPGSPFSSKATLGGSSNQHSAPLQQTQRISNPDCYCSEQHRCPHNDGFDGSGLIDIRIVNRHPKPNPLDSSLNTGQQLSCQSGQELCCPPSNPSVCPAAPVVRTCGERTIIPVPGYKAKQTDAAFGAYPWMSTVLKTSDEYVASGLLIDPQWVLTVAHRVSRHANSPRNLKVRFGEWDASNPDHEPCGYQERQVSRVIIHRRFDVSSLRNDIALLQLAEPVQLQTAPHINSACLPGRGHNFDYSQCWLAGFGKNAFGNRGNYSYVLQEVDLSVVPAQQCQQRLRRTSLGSNFVLDARSFVCAGGEAGKDACEGDGGAPLMCNTDQGWTAAGLVAWGVGCAEHGTPGVYTNIASYSEWIRHQTGYTL